MVGTGDVGKHLLEFAARDESNIEWIVGDVDEERARWACNNAEIIGAIAHPGKFMDLVSLLIQTKFPYQKTQ